jgi:hypothetical protein
MRADSSAPGTTAPVSGPAITSSDSTSSRRPLAASRSRHASPKDRLVELRVSQQALEPRVLRLELL